MIFSRMKYVTVALFAALLLASSAYGQRRVFTNDDLTSAPPAAASQPAPAASAEVSTMSVAEADWKQAMQFQAHLNTVYEELDMIAEKESNPQRKQQWTEMINCITSMLQRNQSRVQDLFAKLPPELQATQRQQLEQEQSEQPSVEETQ